MIYRICHSCALSVHLSRRGKIARSDEVEALWQLIVAMHDSLLLHLHTALPLRARQILCFLLPRNKEKIQLPKKRVTDWKCRKLQLFVEHLADIRCWTWLQKLTLPVLYSSLLKNPGFTAGKSLFSWCCWQHHCTLDHLGYQFPQWMHLSTWLDRKPWWTVGLVGLGY